MNDGKEVATIGGDDGNRDSYDLSSASTSGPPARSTEQSVASITISPATSNKNLKFWGDFREFFRTTSLRSAFQQHAAFQAVFPGPSFEWDGEQLKLTEGKFPGRIVALSEDFLSAETEGKGVGTTERGALDRAFALKGAWKGLVSAIMTAYNQHCNLVISPDDVWLTILAQFSAYVNKNAENLRGRIVEHEGKKQLKVSSVGTLESANYRGMIKDMLGDIRKSIKSPELADWFRPGFSTTTERDEVCAAATAMGSLQAYFDYTIKLDCGIPTVTLMGTTADWKLLREKVDRLLEFEVQSNPDGNIMELWVGYLRKVCDGFVESAEYPGSAKTLEFWDKVLSKEGGGSGPSYITGWVSAFTCFDKDGKFAGTQSDSQNDTLINGVFGISTPTTEFPLINTKDICDNIVSCPVKIDDNGVEYDATLFTGQVVFEAERDDKDAYPTVRPRNDWCMAVPVK